MYGCKIYQSVGELEYSPKISTEDTYLMDLQALIEDAAEHGENLEAFKSGDLLQYNETTRK
jgi:hypothetical protein